MAAGLNMQGLIKWASRDEWREAFEDTLDRHLGPACRAADVAPEELHDIIGDAGRANLWGWAFEDFVSSRRQTPNAAEDYLKRRGWKESPGTRAYIEALGLSTPSLYEVSDIVVDEGFLARDLVRGGEPVRVKERQATRSLAPWDRIAGRVVTARGVTGITGAVLPFPRELSEAALKAIERVRRQAHAEVVKVARKIHPEIKEEVVASVSGVDEALQGAAFLLSNMWLGEVLGRALRPNRPQLQNTEGDPIEFIALHFPLAPQASPDAVKEALDRLPEMEREGDAFWNWLETREPLAPPPRRKKGAQVFSTTMDDSALVLGNVELLPKTLILSVNSEVRADRGRAMLAEALAGLVREPLAERQTVEQMMAAPRSRRDLEPSHIEPEEERRIIHDAMNQHYRKILDEPVPALGGASPRKAARTAKGRPKVVAWLKSLENHSGRSRPGDPVTGYDFTWMWLELGLLAERR